MRKFRTNQLIRNNRLEQMQDDGVIIKYEILSDYDYLKALKEKVVEEATEVFLAKDNEELAKEIADIYEVIEHLIDASNISTETILRIKEEKKEKLGGFNKRIRTLYGSVDEKSCKNFDYIKYFLSQPEKYPEIK